MVFILTYLLETKLCDVWSTCGCITIRLIVVLLSYLTVLVDFNDRSDVVLSKIACAQIGEGGNSSNTGRA
jgi:hypothetical protein